MHAFWFFLKVIITTTIILGTGSKIEPNYQ